MKDEEMAEEYVMGRAKKAIQEQIPYFEFAEQMFLAGLKAGRPQWHKVTDGDLPKIGKSCLVYLVNGDVITARLREDNVWTTNGHNAFESVIAWCELPTFDKE